ncbi:MAG: hypothetical protein KAH14_06915 [Clostridiales bacterium]|nr:hypothetical protein [Clostridiales bacterium]
MKKNKSSGFVNICPIFISEDIETTVTYYIEQLGFRYAKHYNKNTKFAAI